MENESKIDPDSLQRLIDGELSSDEIRALFEVADQHPSWWRTIACAFTEDKLFAKQFESLTEPVDLKQTQSTKPAKATTRESKPAANRISLVKQLAIAASLAVAGLLGYMFGSDGPITNPGGSAAAPNMIADNNSAGTPAVTPVDLQPEYRMELLTPDGEAIDGEVDLYRYNDLHQLVRRGNANSKVSLNDFLPPSGLSTEARQRMNQSGYEINETTNYMSGRLQDGRQFVVPVRSIRFDQGH